MVFVFEFIYSQKTPQSSPLMAQCGVSFSGSLPQHSMFVVAVWYAISLNSLWPRDAIMPIAIWVNIGSGNGFLITDTKP